MKQEQINRNRTVPKMSEVAAQYEAEEHERQMRIARKAVKRARTLIDEAERFLAS
jgi:hypothetical protein